MGLYLCVMDADENEVDGVEVGSYADWDQFRTDVRSLGEAKFPTILLHSDCDGEWSPAECAALDRELVAVADGFSRLPPRSLAPQTWQVEVAKTFGLRPRNLYECYFDVDSEPLIERLQGLSRVAQERGLPILFQ